MTGGTRGIGEAVCIALRENGIKFAATYARDDVRAATFAHKTGIRAFKFDVASFGACQEGVAIIEAEIGSVDIIVNNAGVTRDNTILKQTFQQWKEVIDTNLGGRFTWKAAFPSMPSRDGVGS